MSFQPPSAAGAIASAPSQHMKTSLSIPKPIVTSNISLFLSNLRLLDLDKRPDWPDVTARTFDSKDALQNQKKRISCIEWILFRLFQLLDPEMTKDKLQPFFPPLEPLQSINLRAALFRCFNDLKKNGVLGREITVRKTMLDECKGEKFEEMLVIFSTLVLKKRLLVRRQRRHVPIAQAVATMVNIKPSDIAQVTPLILAHRSSLHSALRRRAVNETLTKTFHDAIKAEHERVAEHHEDIKASRTKLKNILSPDIADHIRDDVRHNWVGSTEGSEILLDGDMPPRSDLRPQTDFKDSLDTFRQTGLLSVNEKSSTLLEQIGERLKYQNSRLAQWREYSELVKSSSQSSRDVLADSPSLVPRVNKATEADSFTEHQTIRLGKTMDNSSSIPSIHCTFPYEHIVACMRHDISRATEKRRLERPTTLDVSTRKLADNDQTTKGSQFFTNGFPVPRSGGTRVPMFQATSQQAKLDFFSPLKAAYFPSSPDTPSQIMEPQSRRLATNVESTITTEDNASFLSYEHEYSPEARDKDDVEPCDSELEIQDSLVALRLSPSAPSTVEDITNSTLADRARASMSSRLVDDSGTLPTDADTPPPPDHSSSSLVPSMSYKSEYNSRVSLAERTRQSLAGLALRPQADLQRRQPRREKSSSSYPINQFETPIKGQTHLARASPDVSELQGGKNTTPRERLFSDEAEYASVFKSRPKIAASPVASPGFDDYTPADHISNHLQHLDDSPLGAIGSNKKWGG